MLEWRYRDLRACPSPNVLFRAVPHGKPLSDSACSPAKWAVFRLCFVRLGLSASEKTAQQLAYAGCAIRVVQLPRWLLSITGYLDNLQPGVAYPACLFLFRLLSRLILLRTPFEDISSHLDLVGLLMCLLMTIPGISWIYRHAVP